MPKTPSTQQFLDESLIEELDRKRRGEAGADARLLEIAYQRLHRMGRRLLADAEENPTLGATALVHEAYIRLFQKENFKDVRTVQHFYGVFARAMRSALIDYNRRKQSLKRGGQAIRNYDLDTIAIALHLDRFDLLALDEVLSMLNSVHDRAARMVELKFFAGMTVDEIVQVEQVSRSTVEADLRFAKAFLRSRLQVPPA